MARKAKAKDTTETVDVLTEIFDNVSNNAKEFGGLNDAFNLDEDLRYISTGDDILDLIISNRPNGGLPLSKYVNLFSDSGIGKSLLVAKIIASAQKMGGYAFLFDVERGSYKSYFKVLGVDTKRLKVIDNVHTVEKLFATVVPLIEQFKKQRLDVPLVIAVDSMTAITTESGANLEEHGKQGYGVGAEKQNLLHDELRKVMPILKDSNVLFVTTDQIRDKIGAMQWEKKTRDTAGHAQKFYSDIRVELSKKGTLKDENKVEIGNEVQAYIVKNRVAPPFRKCSIFLYHTRGLDRYKSWIENGKSLGVLKAAGKYIKFEVNGEEFRTEEGNLPTATDLKKLLRENKEVKSAIYNQICDKMIVRYENEGEEAFEDLEEIVEIDRSSAMEQFQTTNASDLTSDE